MHGWRKRVDCFYRLEGCRSPISLWSTGLQGQARQYGGYHVPSEAGGSSGAPWSEACTPAETQKATCRLLKCVDDDALTGDRQAELRRKSTARKNAHERKREEKEERWRQWRSEQKERLFAREGAKELALLSSESGRG